MVDGAVMVSLVADVEDAVVDASSVVVDKAAEVVGVITARWQRQFRDPRILSSTIAGPVVKREVCCVVVGARLTCAGADSERTADLLEGCHRALGLVLLIFVIGIGVGAAADVGDLVADFGRAVNADVAEVGWVGLGTVGVSCGAREKRNGWGWDVCWVGRGSGKNCDRVERE